MSLRMPGLQESDRLAGQTRPLFAEVLAGEDAAAV
jgi:hypothetical protein